MNPLGKRAPLADVLDAQPWHEGIVNWGQAGTLGDLWRSWEANGHEEDYVRHFQEREMLIDDCRVGSLTEVFVGLCWLQVDLLVLMCSKH